MRPDWWKLEPAADAAAWREIEAAVNENDPLCRGVVLLGLSAPEAELLAAFEVAAPFAIVKGFADAMGVGIEARNNADLGATFALLFPQRLVVSEERLGNGAQTADH